MAFNLGDIFVTFKAKTDDLQSGVTKVKTMTGDVERTVNNTSFRKFSSEASNAFGTIADKVQGVATRVALLGVAGSVGIGAMAKAAFGQVKAVEEASFALRAYEKDAGKVNKVLNDLVAYARSDMGVLFQRQDLFDAASTLRMYGAETDTLTDKVKILSKGVSLGKTTFQELSQIVGRAAARGRLDAVDFDMLIERGIGLDKSMRGASITSEELFKALDKALPAELLAGRANTIQGRMIRLQSGFRDLGLSILGVDRDTSQFTKGGLGDKLVNMMDQLRVVLTDPKLKAAFQKLGESLASFAERAIPALVKGFQWLMNNGTTVKSILLGVGAAFLVAKAAAIGFSIAASITPVGLIAAAISALVGVLVALQVRFDWVGKTINFVKDVIAQLAQWFDVSKNAVKSFGEELLLLAQGALSFLKDRIGDLIDAWNAVRDTAKDIFAAIAGWIEDHITWIKNISIVIGTFLLPKIIAIGVEWVKTAAKAIWSFVTTSASATLEGGKTVVAWSLAAAQTAWVWTTQTLPRVTMAFIAMSYQATVNAIKVAVAWALSAGSTMLSWASAFAAYLLGVGAVVLQTALAAARMAVSWALALGPIGLIAAAVIAVGALIIANWEVVKSWFSSLWDWIKGAASSAGDWIRGVFTGAADIVKGAWRSVVDFFRDAASRIGGFFANIGDAIASPFKAAFNAVSGFWNKTIGKLNIKVPDWVPGLGGKGFSMPSLPGLAMGTSNWRGGIVGAMNEFGPETAVLPKGTKVVTADETRRRSSAGGNTYNINLNGVMARSESELADIMEGAIRTLDRRLAGAGKPQLLGGRS